MRQLLRLLPLCLLAVLPPVTASAQALDGQWAGSLSCSENLANRNPGYTVSIELQVSGATGRAERLDAQSLETFALQVLPSGTVELQSTGRLRGDTAPRWTTRFAGRPSGGDRMDLTGQMFGADGKTLVRERCSVALQRTAVPAAGSAPPGSGDALTEQLRRALESTSSDSAEQRLAANSQGAPMNAVIPFKVDAVGNSLPGTPSIHAAALRYPGIAAAFPEWLMESGQPWSFKTPRSASPRHLSTRPPTLRESELFNEARRVVESREVKAIAFVEGSRIVQVIGRPGVVPSTHLPSASISKTVTAVGIGKAVCNGRISLNTPLETYIPGLRGTAIGRATVEQALTMTSGSAIHAHEITPEETRFHFAGDGSLEELLNSPRFSRSSSAAGSNFVYKSVDPYLVATAAQAAVGQPFTAFLRDALFSEVATAHPVVLDTDRKGNFLATGGVRMALEDWIRFATYVREQRAASGCFADYLKTLSQKRLRIGKIPGVNGFFNGYGYLTWVDHDTVANSFWAVGHFGQRIGWSTEPSNPRVLLTFGLESDRDMPAIYSLAQRWLNP